MWRLSLYFVAFYPCRCFCWRLLMVNYSLSWMSSFLVVVLCLTMEMLEMLDHQKWEEVWLWHACDQYKNSFSLPLKYLSRRILISPTWDSNHPISGEYKGFAPKESNEEEKKTLKKIYGRWINLERLGKFLISLNGGGGGVVVGSGGGCGGVVGSVVVIVWWCR